MRNSIKTRLVTSVAALLFLFASTAFKEVQAQSCNVFPTAAGFHTAGGFGGCVMQFDITYDCGSGPVLITCYLDAGGDGFDLPAGCCLVDVVVTTPYNGSATVDPNIPHQNIPLPPSGLPFPVGPTPCDQHDVHDIHWNFPGGPCRPGDIHIN